MKKLPAILALSLALAVPSSLASATPLPMNGLHNGNSDLVLARKGDGGGGKHAGAGMRQSPGAMRGPSVRSGKMTSAHVYKQSEAVRGRQKVTHREVTTYRGKTGARHVYNSSGKNVRQASAWHVQNWHHRNYYGRVVHGVTIGTIILVAGVPPLAPAPDLCWYWADYSYNRGYWDYCYY